MPEHCHATAPRLDHPRPGIDRIRRGQPPLQGHGRLWVLLAVFGMLFSFWPASAHAECTFDQVNIFGYTFTYAPAPVNFKLATSTISIPYTLPAQGTILGSPVTASPSYPAAHATCAGGESYGVVNLVGATAPIGGSNYIYKTSVPGVGYQLIHSNNAGGFMGPYGTGTATAGSSAYNVSTTLQLVQYGAIPNGAVLPAGTLANWQWGSIVPEYFVLQNSITFVAAACQATNVTVVLPTVSSTAFNGKDSTAGTTPFDIDLTCPTGSTTKLSIQLDASSGTPGGYPNVLKNMGTANGVGVDLLDASALATGTPVTLGTPTQVGTSLSGQVSLPYFARYHAIKNKVTAGTVVATATFTLTYN